MAKLGDKSGRPRPVMNVTPLVDVVLVLLIIFMLVIPMLERAAQVDLPSIFNVDDDPRGNADPFTLSVTRQGELFLEDERLNERDLESRLREANRREPHRRLVLRGDRRAPYARVRTLFALCQRIGFPGVSLSVHERGEGSG
jgi:biopolymer transport protein ExbD/biopolymer transport protein TolR